MSDLLIDGDSLREAARRIREVVDSFATVGADAHDAADYVGHRGLGRRVREFADGWDIHRGKYSDELRRMADMLQAVDDTFTDLDSHIVEKGREATATVAAALIEAGHTGSQAAPPLTGGHGA